MARKRMIDPDFWTDEKLGQCKPIERLFFMGLISNADDEGRGRGNIRLLRSTIFPYDEDIKVKDVEQMACSLMDKGMAYFYIVDGQEFYYLPNFTKHQVINKSTESKLPEMPINQAEVVLPEYYRSVTTPLPPKRKEEKRREEKIKYADFVTLTLKEYNSLVEKFGEAGTKDRIENLNLYKGSKGVKYDSDYLTVLAWERRHAERASPGATVVKPNAAEDIDRILDELEGTGSG